ncbi:MAG: class I SAM-dependent methyltransferase [Candidatus Berkelbacteria bacterium]|nr:class I SAM-dependent methyltransferase [Candidatus Berkelbacteria bacterium]
MIYLDVSFLLLALFVFVWSISGIIALACGAPAVYADSRLIGEIFKLAKIKKEQIVLDLGCGDARSLIIAAKNYGAQGIGFEVSPFAYLKSKLNVLFSGHTKNVKIYFGDARKAKNEIKKADIIYLYLFDKILREIEPMVFSAARPGTIICSLGFQFKNHKPYLSKPLQNCKRITKVYFYKV